MWVQIDHEKFKHPRTGQWVMYDLSKKAKARRARSKAVEAWCSFDYSGDTALKKIAKGLSRIASDLERIARINSETGEDLVWPQPPEGAEIRQASEIGKKR